MRAIAVTILTRRPTAHAATIAWNRMAQPGALPRHLDGADAVVNLAGRRHRRQALDRRRGRRRCATAASSSTRTLVRAVAQCAHPPRVFVSGSAVGYYGPRGDEPITETAPRRVGLSGAAVRRMGTGGAHGRIAGDAAGDRSDRPRAGWRWRRAARRCCCRSSSGSARRSASGDQFMPWIHVDDWTALVSWLMQNDRATGAFNATAPDAGHQSHVHAHARRACCTGRRCCTLRHSCCAPRSARCRRSLVNGQRVLPAAAEQLGFRFTHRALEPALGVSRGLTP